MPMIQNDHTSLAPSLDTATLPWVSDDECVVRLAKAIQDHDADKLDELAMLIGRLAVAIE